MADASFVQSSFIGGEISKLMQGRIDRPEYRTCLNVCLNSIPNETGAWVRRPGLQFASTTRAGAAGRVMKFDFDVGLPYTLEFTDGHLRFRSGATVASDSDIGATISAANPAVAVLDSASAWSTGDQVYLSNLGANAPLLQNRQFALTKIDTTHFSLADAVTGAAIDSSAYGGVRATVHHIRDMPTAYTSGLWSSLRIVQTESVGFLLAPTVQPYALVVTAEPTDSSFAVFTLATATFEDGPYFDPITTIGLTPSDVDGVITLAASATGADFGGFVATDVGRSLRLFSQPPQWISAGVYSIGDGVRDKGVYYGCFSAVTSATPPANDPAHWTIAPQNARWAWGTITGFTDELTVEFTFAFGNFIYAWNPSTIPDIIVWRLGLYSGTTGQPTCGTYHEGRLWLSGAVKNRIDGCVSNGIKGGVVNFAPTGNGLDENDSDSGLVSDRNAISYLFNAPDAEPIIWMTPDLQGIICGTKAGEWLVVAPTSGGLTPFNIAARRVTKIGCADIEPQRTEHTTIFVQKFGRKIMEYFADVFSGKFTAPHLTFPAKHLTIGGVQEIAYQQELSPTVWARVNGALRGCTYKRDTLMTSQGPAAAGWHRHTLGSGRTVESIVVGPSLGGTHDTLTMVTNDPLTNVRHVELMGDVLDEGSTLAEAAYLDNAVTPSSTTEAAPADGMPYGGLTLNGLWHLNAKTVTAWLGGLDCGDYTVASGSITVPYGDGISAGSGSGLFTADFVAGFSGDMPMLVGFTYTSDGQIVRPNSREESGARSGPAFGKKRREHQFAVLLEGAQGVSFGTRFTKLDAALFKDDNGATLAVNVQFNGIYRATISDDYSYDGMICWRVTRPYICNIAAISGFLQTQDA